MSWSKRMSSRVMQGWVIGALCTSIGCSGEGTLARQRALGDATNGGAGAGAASGDRAAGNARGGSASNGDTAPPVAASVSIDSRTPTTRTGTWSLNYWTWSPTYGDAVTGTEDAIATLAPALLRFGGYNNDANTPDAFDEAALDRAVAYARAIGAEPLLQLPLLFNASGQRPSPDESAALVSYANVMRGYGIKYISIGNEPDLYPDAGALSNPAQPAVPGYTPERYCEEAAPIVAAAKAIDPALTVVGPDLGYKYQSFADWLTPILSNCGALFDVIAVHRYPFEAQQATPSDVQADPLALGAWADDLRRIMSQTGAGNKPLALTEMNLAYVAPALGYPGGSILGSIQHALWVVDALGRGAQLGLWTTAYWDVSDPDAFALGLLGLPPTHSPRAPYYALQLFAAHTGEALLDATTSTSNIRAYATLRARDSATELLITHWIDGSVALDIGGLSLVVPALSICALEIPDRIDLPSAWVYGQGQLQRGVGPEPIEVSR